jgi:CheY-like chemotaxis protein
MEPAQRPVVILIAEDDDDDFLLTREALQSFLPQSGLKRVRDGEELVDYLRRRMKDEPAEAPEPSLIFLDLNMPRKDGREALSEIKSHPQLRRIPVIVLTTSEAEEDVRRSYELGANSYICKPMRFEQFRSTIELICRYWFEAAALPRER